MAQPSNPAPRLPSAPMNYDITFMEDLIRSIELFIEQERNPGEERATKGVFTALPTSDTGLEVGSLYRIGNDVKISLANIAVPDSATGTMSVGTVTVTTA